MSTYTSNGVDMDWTLKGNVVRWDSNGRVPFDDVLAKLEAAGHITKLQRLLSADAREMEVAAFLSEYRAAYKGPSDEERAEARAAHGAGVSLTNVITGHRWTT